MKPTAPLRHKLSVFATAPCRGLSRSRLGTIMKRKLLLALITLQLVVAICFAAGKQTPESFLQSLYLSEHNPMTKKEIDFTKRESLTKYFGSELTDLFIKDFECQKREQGVCNLDFDPILDAQDFEKTTNLKVSRVKGEASQFKVTFTNLGTRTLIYKLKKTENGWRISDIKYPEGPSLKELLSSEIK